MKKIKESAGEPKSSIATQQHTAKKATELTSIHCGNSVSVDNQPEVVGMLVATEKVSSAEIKESSAVAQIPILYAEPASFKPELMVCDDPIPVPDEAADKLTIHKENQTAKSSKPQPKAPQEENDV